MKKVTPVLGVDAIEPVLPFWTGLGFEVTTEVPHGDALGFVILANGPVELMYQTWSSIADDVAELAQVARHGSMLFIEVDDLDWVDARLGETPRIVDRRKTFYGAEEIIVREPGGHVVNFARFGGQNEMPSLE